MDPGWFYRRDGQEIGPVSAARIKELLLAGEIQAHQAIWHRSEASLRYVQADTLLEENVAHG